MGQQRAVIDYNKLSLLLVIGAIFYNEFLAYYSAYSRWPNIKYPSESLRILFVADPQIQGVLFESPFPVGPITRWDSDRYLSKTFSWAVSAYNPQVVVFLGDLIDEGSEVDESLFSAYTERFNSIYGGFDRSVKTFIYVPGDNDIGGEGGDPVTDEKIRRFKDHFPPKPVYIFKGVSGADISTADEAIRNSNPESTVVEVVPVSLLTQRSPAEWGELSPPTKHTFRMVISHLPVMPTQNSQFTVNVLKYIEPTVIFSAHDHRGMDYVGTRKTGRSTGNITFFSQNNPETEDEFLVIKPPAVVANDVKFDSPREEAEALNSDDEENVVHEIVVPTCSYRMGVKEMAFGLGVIRMKGSDPPEMYYTNIWLPSRFALLYIYVATILCSFVLLCLGRCQGARRGRRNSKSGRRSASSSPSPASKYTKIV